MFKWFARLILSLIPLSIIGVWVLGNNVLFFHMHDKGLNDFLAILGALVGLVDIFLVFGSLALLAVNLQRICRWLWFTAELELPIRNNFRRM